MSQGNEDKTLLESLGLPPHTEIEQSVWNDIDVASGWDKSVPHSSESQSLVSQPPLTFGSSTTSVSDHIWKDVDEFMSGANTIMGAVEHPYEEFLSECGVEHYLPLREDSFPHFFLFIILMTLIRSIMRSIATIY